MSSMKITVNKVVNERVEGFINPLEVIDSLSSNFRGETISRGEYINESGLWCVDVKYHKWETEEGEKATEEEIEIMNALRVLRNYYAKN